MDNQPPEPTIPTPNPAPQPGTPEPTVATQASPDPAQAALDQPATGPITAQPPTNPALASAPVKPAPSFPSSGASTFALEQSINLQDGSAPKKKMSKKTKILIAIIASVCLLPPLVLVIFMSSVALPSMQASQRDTQRRNDYSLLSSNITSYMIENDGSLPNTGTLNPEKYMVSIDPSGNQYSITVIECNSANNCPGEPAVNAGEVYVVKNAKCDNGMLVTKDSRHSFVIWGYLETGKSTRYYCSASN